MAEAISKFAGYWLALKENKLLFSPQGILRLFQCKANKNLSLGPFLSEIGNKKVQVGLLLKPRNKPITDNYVLLGFVWA